MAKQMTPLLRPLRDNSGTIYVFPSAVEDIGLNLDNRANKVALTKFVVLNLPETDTTYSTTDTQTNSRKNCFNFTNIPGIANIFNNNTSLKNNREKIAAALQNYMMNMETTMINQEDYDYSASATISERVFWKFLKETGAIRWTPVNSDTATLNGEIIYKEEDDSSTGYTRVVQSIGQISAGNSVSSDFGMYNETYVNIPTTYGGSEVYFKVVEDNNYRLGEVYTSENGEYLAGRNADLSSETYTINYPAYDTLTNSFTNNTEEEIRAYVADSSNLAWYMYTDEGNVSVENSYFTEERFDAENDSEINYSIKLYGTDNEYDGTTSENNTRTFLRSRLDGVEVVTDIDEIDNIYDQVVPNHAFISYDSINIDNDLIHTTNYDFNAILLYYTIYDKDNNNELATNAFGIVFLSSPDVNTMSTAYNTGDAMQFVLPTYAKKKSGGAGSGNYFGTGFSFKINIRSLSIYDNTDAYLEDETTSAGIYTEDFAETMYSLNKSVELLQKNSLILSSVYSDYSDMKAELDDAEYSLQKLQRQLNLFNKNKFKDIDSSNIITYDLDVYHRTNISGQLNIDASTDFNIPYLDVSSFVAWGDVSSNTAYFKNLKASDLEIENVETEELKVETLIVNSGGLYMDDCNQYLSNDSNIYRQVIQPMSYTTLDEGHTYYDYIKQFINETEVAPINGTFEMTPESVSTAANNEDSSNLFVNLYTAENGGGYINYQAYIPLLVAAVQHLIEDVSTLKNS